MNAPETSAWTGYNKWRKFSWIIFPCIICLNIFPAAWPIFAPMLGYGIYCGLKVHYFDCPKCDEPFFMNPRFPRFYWPWTDICMNCGFPKWGEPPSKVDVYPIPREENRSRDPLLAERLRLAEFLTLVLRDDPKVIGLRLDANGWANVDDVFNRAKRNGIKLTGENLAEVLTASSFHCLEWDRTGNRIRASENLAVTVDR